jgi:ankyrin repeat protein
MKQFVSTLGAVTLLVGLNCVALAQATAPTPGHQAAAAPKTDVNARDKNGRTPLYIAAESGSSSTVKFLIAAGSDVNAKANKGTTALMAAAEYGRADSIDILIASGAAVDAKDNKGWTALMFATRLIDPLLSRDEHGAFHVDPDYSPDRTISALIAAGADMKMTDENGATALIGARCYNCVKLLIAQGADVNVRDHSGRTAIMWMASPPGDPVGGYGDPRIVKLLVGGGADINARDSDGRTPLMLASTYVHTTIRFINAPDGRGVYLSGLEKKVCDKTLVTTLIENGADVKAKDNAGKSVMSLARSAKSDCVKILHDAHAK